MQVLGSLVLITVVLVLAAIVALVRSGRAVPAPWGTLRSRPWEKLW